MNGNDLRKLNRKQLLELLLKQTMRVEELERQLQEMEQQNVQFDMIKQIKVMFEDMERKCAKREAEAERKIEAANNKIAEAQRIIESVKAQQNKKEAIATVAEQPEKKEEIINEEPKDILDDFFSGVIGKQNYAGKK